VDLARTGLGAPPKAMLLLGKTGPSGLGHADGEGIVFPLFICFSSFVL
jgi:hypothetical protein